MRSKILRIMTTITLTINLLFSARADDEVGMRLRLVPNFELTGIGQDVEFSVEVKEMKGGITSMALDIMYDGSMLQAVDEQDEHNESQITTDHVGQVSIVMDGTLTPSMKCVGRIKFKCLKVGGTSLYVGSQSNAVSEDLGSYQIRGQSTSITIKERVDVDSVTLNKDLLTLKEEQSETLLATVYPRNATDQTITWSSANRKIATVDKETGVVTARSEGDTTITATCEGKATSAKIRVLPSKKDDVIKNPNVNNSNHNVQNPVDNKNPNKYTHHKPVKVKPSNVSHNQTPPSQPPQTHSPYIPSDPPKIKSNTLKTPNTSDAPFPFYLLHLSIICSLILFVKRKKV